MIALQSLISLLLLFLLVFVLYNKYRLDLVRQELFDIRDRLFDEAMNNQIAFDSPAYRYARTVINGMIRFSHRLSLSRLLVSMLLASEEGLEEVKREARTIYSGSSPGDRAMCDRYLLEANRTLVKHLCTSPFLLTVLSPLLAAIYGWISGKNAASAIVRWYRAFLARLDFLAYREGQSTNRREHRALATRF